MSFKKVETTKFELNNAHTFGVEEGKYGGFTIHLDLDSETYQKVHQLYVDHTVSNKLYGTTLYLKTKVLSTKNREELLNKGNQDISINFETTGVYTRSGKKHLIFEVTSLCTRDASASQLENPDRSVAEVSIANDSISERSISPRDEYDDFRSRCVGKRGNCCN